ncbi:MAG: hypothetical protein OEM43_05405, partial [Gammaproteobacteria bacterium]|nr:hypothetical protein [Gammaproteobacteria bacterium]
MANIQIGVVLSLQGQASVTHADGAAEKLQEGSQVFLNDVVTTGKNAAVLISFLDGSVFEIGAAFTAILNTDVFDP